MKNTGKTVSFVALALCVVTLLSSCMLFFYQEPRYEIVGTWRRTAGQFNSTITYYLKADGTYSYSNNQNGDLDSGEYIIDWNGGTMTTIHQMNHSLDRVYPFSFDGPDTLFIDGQVYFRVK